VAGEQWRGVEETDVSEVGPADDIVDGGLDLGV
jgi:hypothetical protein